MVQAVATKYMVVLVSRHWHTSQSGYGRVSIWPLVHIEWSVAIHQCYMRSFELRLTEMVGGSILPDESEMDM